MTTNRVLTLDAAMVSRIHYAISLPPLNREQEDQIWKSYLQQLTTKNCAEIGPIKTWAEKQTKKSPSGLNGREIRNLFTAAQMLAVGDSEGNGKIHLTHMQRIFETMQGFRKDMNRLLIEAGMVSVRS
jgi:ATP-dependent 26S proteasome regulatory subunit